MARFTYSHMSMVSSLLAAGLIVTPCSNASTGVLINHWRLTGASVGSTETTPQFEFERVSSVNSKSDDSFDAVTNDDRMQKDASVTVNHDALKGVSALLNRYVSQERDPFTGSYASEGDISPTSILELAEETPVTESTILGSVNGLTTESIDITTPNGITETVMRTFNNIPTDDITDSTGTETFLSDSHVVTESIIFDETSATINGTFTLTGTDDVGGRTVFNTLTDFPHNTGIDRETIILDGITAEYTITADGNPFTHDYPATIEIISSQPDGSFITNVAQGEIVTPYSFEGIATKTIDGSVVTVPEEATWNPHEVPQIYVTQQGNTVSITVMSVTDGSYTEIVQTSVITSPVGSVDHSVSVSPVGSVDHSVSVSPVGSVDHSVSINPNGDDDHSDVGTGHEDSGVSGPFGIITRFFEGIIHFLENIIKEVMNLFDGLFGLDDLSGSTGSDTDLAIDSFSGLLGDGDRREFVGRDEKLVTFMGMDADRDSLGIDEWHHSGFLSEDLDRLVRWGVDVFSHDSADTRDGIDTKIFADEAEKFMNTPNNLVGRIDFDDRDVQGDFESQSIAAEPIEDKFTIEPVKVSNSLEIPVAFDNVTPKELTHIDQNVFLDELITMQLNHDLFLSNEFDTTGFSNLTDLLEL